MLFSKKEFLMPIDGEIINLEKVPDEVFSQKMMGDGFAINPSSGKVYSPIDGEIKTAFPTGHAVGISNSKLEILIHFGMDTVNLKGEGFDLKVAVGDTVKKGDLLIDIDLKSIKSKVPSTITPIIFTGGIDKINLSDLEYKTQSSKDPILKY